MPHTIRRTVFSDHTVISTVYRDRALRVMDALLDPVLGRDSTKLYETMVFPNGSYPQESECIRYDTLQRAQDNHADMVRERITKMVLSGCDGEKVIIEDDARPFMIPEGEGEPDSGLADIVFPMDDGTHARITVTTKPDPDDATATKH